MSIPSKARGKLKPGFNPNVPSWGQLHAAFGPRGADRAVQVPQELHWLKGDLNGKFGKLGNAFDPANPTAPLVGDCGVVGAIRKIQLDHWIITGEVLEWPLELALDLYKRWGNWNPADPSSDQGTVLVDNLTDWKLNGITKPDGTIHKIVGFFQVDYRNQQDLKTAIAVTGPLYIGQNIPDAWESSTYWDAVGPGTGGHCTNLTGFGVAEFDEESWDEQVTETAGAVGAYMDEAWAVANPDWIEGTGKTPFGLTMQEINDACKDI
jgi:hypothetical protein